VEVEADGTISYLLVCRVKTGNNSIQFFIIYMLSQQPQGQLQTQHSVEKVVTYWTKTT
jgi:hypothetical protein